MFLVYLLKAVLKQIGFSKEGKYDDGEIYVLQRNKGCKYAKLLFPHSFKKNWQKEESKPKSNMSDSANMSLKNWLWYSSNGLLKI